MNAKKTLLVAGASTIVGLASFAAVASAATPGNAASGDTLVDKIATRFNLNKSDVQAVFDADRSAHKVEHEQRMEDRLTQAVADGKITSAQKDQIIAKHTELKAYMDSIKDKSDTERKTLMQAKMTEVEQWASDNGLSDYFGPQGGGKGEGLGFDHKVMRDRFLGDTGKTN